MSIPSAQTMIFKTISPGEMADSKSGAEKLLYQRSLQQLVKPDNKEAVKGTQGHVKTTGDVKCRDNFKLSFNGDNNYNESISNTVTLNMLQFISSQ